MRYTIPHIEQLDCNSYNHQQDTIENELVQNTINQSNGNSKLCKHFDQTYCCKCSHILPRNNQGLIGNVHNSEE